MTLDQDSVFCSNCGTSILAASRFCENCGAAQDGEGARAWSDPADDVTLIQPRGETPPSSPADPIALPAQGTGSHLWAGDPAAPAPADAPIPAPPPPASAPPAPRPPPDPPAPAQPIAAAPPPPPAPDPPAPAQPIAAAPPTPLAPDPPAPDPAPPPAADPPSPAQPIAAAPPPPPAPDPPSPAQPIASTPPPPPAPDPPDPAQPIAAAPPPPPDPAPPLASAPPPPPAPAQPIAAAPPPPPAPDPAPPLASAPPPAAPDPPAPPPPVPQLTKSPVPAAPMLTKSPPPDTAFCPNCGRAYDADAQFCVGCGTKRGSAHAPPGTPPAPGAPPPPPAGTAPLGPNLDAARAKAAEWQKALPPRFHAAPLELLFVCALMAIAGLLALYPPIRILPETFDLLGAGGLARLFGILTLTLAAMLIFVGVALLYLAWKMVHGDRVARGLAYVLLGGFGVAIALGDEHSTELVLAMLGCFGAVAVLALAPRVQQFFAGAAAPDSDQPTPVVIARTLVAVWSGIIIFLGVMFLPLSDLEGKFLPIGLVLIALGAAAWYLNTLLAKGDPMARILITAGAGVYFVLLLVLGDRSPSLIVPLALAVGVVFNLWMPKESQLYFGQPGTGPPHPPPPHHSPPPPAPPPPPPPPH